MQNDATTVRNAVDSVIKRLTEPGRGKRVGKFTAWGTAMLAKLRRAAGASPGESADIWEVTIGALPDGWIEEDRERAELAVHTALTLFGLHQQGSYKSVHANSIGFGKAVKGIVNSNPSSEAGVRRRFNALATASEFGELSFHARGLVQLMRAKGSGFDYPGFAEELYRYQTGPEERDRVRMRWARDFYAFDKTEQKQNIEEDDRHE